MEQLDKVLQGRGENHIQPFLWVHGEDAETLRAEVRAIHDAGIGALCVEARPHKDFNGPGWFSDLGTILDECKRLGMTMWVLDDSHFPTGFADGAVKRDHPELQKQFLYCKVLDFAGPATGVAALLKYALRSTEDQVLGVRLYRRGGFEKIDPAESIDVMGSIERYDDASTGTVMRDMIGRPLPGNPTYGPTTTVRFDLPAGQWSLCVVASSYQGGEKQTAGYLNPIQAEATQVLLDTVYQPIYEHFADDFGKAFRGFFSDEPRFGNIHGSEGASIGRNSAMDLPWRPGMLGMLEEELGGTSLEGRDLVGLLPLLFVGGATPEAEKDAHVLRYAYMDLVSRLYGENFDGVLGAWCHEHGCEHIGHIIEDNDATARLGYGAGHYFRAVGHQDMAGVDVVIQQLLPGMDQGMFKGMHSPGWDGEYFTYVLGKLGGSMAHLDARKRGRCMVELFGAYGWSEGNRLCKWMADYFLVRGVNEFVPHAFDPAPFPDQDCPPHFYAHGQNPQYPEMGQLMRYMNNMSEVLRGTSCAPVALLYHAEAEWSGEYMELAKPAAALARAFVDYDIVPADYLAADSAEGGRLRLNGMAFRALVVPYAEALPSALLGDVAGYAAAGLPVIFVGGLPERTSEGVGLPDLSGCEVVALEDLPAAVAACGAVDLTLDEPAPYLRYYHARQADGDVYLFTNEGLEPVRAEVSGAVDGTAYVYDAFANALVEDGAPFSLALEPYESRCVVVPDGGAAYETTAAVPAGEAAERIELLPSSVRLADAETRCEGWGEPVETDGWQAIDTLPGYQGFAGRIRYEVEVEITAEQAGRPARLVLEGVPEGAVVTANGTDCGTRICPPYEYDLTGALREGNNALVIEANTTLGRRMCDFLSGFMLLEPLGITGGATLELQ